MKIGKIIKENRAAKNITQEELANEFFVSRPLISKWENGKSYPDLEQLLKLSDFFDLTLDELLRGDKKMTNKLNFDSRKKRALVLLSILLLIVTGNYLLSTISFAANAKQIEIKNVEMIRDSNYNGGDSERDWNSVTMADIKSKNIFFKPKTDSFLVSMDEGDILGQFEGTYSFFNIFNGKTTVPVKQTMLINDSMANLSFKFKDADMKVLVKIY